MSEWLMILLFSLPPALIAIGLAMWIIMWRQREREAVRRLLDGVKAQDEVQQAALKQFLSANMHLDDKKAGKQAAAIQQARRDLQKAVLSALLERSATKAEAVNVAISAFAAAYQALEPVLPTVPAPATASGRSGEDAGRFREENERLRREVQMTLGTLNNIFAEYASMFGDENTRRDMSVDQILQSMQALSEGSGSYAAGEEEMSPSAAATTRSTEPDEESGMLTHDAAHDHPMADDDAFPVDADDLIAQAASARDPAHHDADPDANEMPAAAEEAAVKAADDDLDAMPDLDALLIGEDGKSKP
jgi:single-stranded DNA-binding protein